MQLLCLGDLALADKSLLQQRWPLPEGLALGNELRVLLNWELAIGDTLNANPRSSGPRLLSLPDSPAVIEKWSPGFATLATNHILDAGEEGLVNTIDSLNRAGFETVGAGRTQEEITAPLFWETSDGRLAIVNWVFPETHPDWMAIPGPNCWPGPLDAERTIRSLKKTADWVLVVVHWSDEHFPYPRPEDRTTAHELARMGTDFIVGHHPHVVRGVEILHSCPVFYSIGNFYFSNFQDEYGTRTVRQAPRHLEGLGVQISFTKDKHPTYKTLSFRQSKNKVILDASHRATVRMKRFSRPLRRLQDSRYNEWYGIRRVHFDRWGGRWHFGVRRLGLWGTIHRLLRLLYSQLYSVF